MTRAGRLLALLATLLLVPVAVAQAGIVQSLTIDGPSPEIVSLGGVAMGEDGSGGVVYLRGAATAHVFVALLSGGSFHAAVQVDPGVATPASQPQIAATVGGRVAVVWISGGELWGAVHGVGARSFGAPQEIAPALSDPSISMSLSGTAFVSWTAVDGSGTAIDVARLDRSSTQFVVLAGPLSSDPGSMPGTGALRSRVAVASDATGIVAWGQEGSDGRTHVLLRRVFGLNESVLTIDATVSSLDGEAGLGADTPVVAVDDDSSYPWIAFRQTFDDGAGTVSRIVLEEIVGSEVQPPITADSLSFPASQGAVNPALAIDGGGDGLFAAALGSSLDVVGATTTTSNVDDTSEPDSWTPGQTINTFGDSLLPAPAVALGRDDFGVLAWEPDAGSVEAQLYEGGTPAQVVQFSRSTLGPIDADGLAAAQDAHGDSVVAFVQGSPAQIAVGVLAPAPGGFHLVGASAGTRPTLSWTASSDSWSAVTYRVLVDGVQVTSTHLTHYRLTKALKSGVHRWRVVAVDGLGQERTTPLATLRVKGAHASAPVSKHANPRDR